MSCPIFSSCHSINADNWWHDSKGWPGFSYCVTTFFSHRSRQFAFFSLVSSFSLHIFSMFSLISARHIRSMGVRLVPLKSFWRATIYVLTVSYHSSTASWKQRNPVTLIHISKPSTRVRRYLYADVSASHAYWCSLIIYTLYNFNILLYKPELFVLSLIIPIIYYIMRKNIKRRIKDQYHAFTFFCDSHSFNGKRSEGLVALYRCLFGY